MTREFDQRFISVSRFIMGCNMDYILVYVKFKFPSNFQTLSSKGVGSEDAGCSSTGVIRGCHRGRNYVPS